MNIRKFETKDTNQVINLLKESNLFHKPYDGWSALMWRLAVSKEYRSGGIGTALAGQMERILKKKVARNIYVVIGQNNRKSIEFFKNHGYYLDTKCWTAGKFV